MSDLLISPTEADIRQALNAFYERHRPRHTPTYVDGIAIGETINGMDVTGYYFGKETVQYLIKARARAGITKYEDALDWRWPSQDQPASLHLSNTELFYALRSRADAKKYAPAQMVCAYRANHGLELLRDSRNVPIAYFAATKAGQRLVKQLGMDWFQTRIFEPQQLRGKLVGKGSEGITYRISACGRILALKLFSEEAQRRMEAIGSALHQVYEPPIFSNRLGWTQALLKELRDFPLQYADLTSPREYAASASYLLSDFVKGTGLNHLLAAVDLLPIYMHGSSKRGERCIKQWDIRKKALTQLEQEMCALEAATTVLRNMKGTFSSGVRGQADLARSNILVTGYCRYSERFRLSIIDQGQYPPLLYVGDAIWADHDKAETHQHAWQLLASREPTRRWLEKHNIPELIGAFAPET